jgi:hypothetical protein
VSKDSTALNEDLLNEFSNKLETTINEICEKHSDLDPRLELLVILGMFCSQVGLDSGYNRQEFLALIASMFDDSFDDSEELPNKNDISKFN